MLLSAKVIRAGLSMIGLLGEGIGIGIGIVLSALIVIWGIGVVVYKGFYISIIDNVLGIFSKLGINSEINIQITGEDIGAIVGIICGLTVILSIIKVFNWLYWKGGYYFRHKKGMVNRDLIIREYDILEIILVGGLWGSILTKNLMIGLIIIIPLIIIILEDKRCPGWEYFITKIINMNVLMIIGALIRVYVVNTTIERWYGGIGILILIISILDFMANLEDRENDIFWGHVLILGMGVIAHGIIRLCTGVEEYNLIFVIYYNWGGGISIWMENKGVNRGIKILAREWICWDWIMDKKEGWRDKFREGLIGLMGKKGVKSGKKGNMGGKGDGERKIEWIMIIIINILIGIILILKYKGIIGIRGLLVLGTIMLCIIRREWLWRNKKEGEGIWNEEMIMWLNRREKELKREEGGILKDKRIEKKGLIWMISGIGVGVIIEGIIKKMGGEIGIIILSILLEGLMIIWYIWREKIIYEWGFIIVITKMSLEEVIMLMYLKLRVKITYIYAWRLRRKEEWWGAYKERHKAVMKGIKIITTMEIEDMRGIGKLIMEWMRCVWGLMIIFIIKVVYLYNRIWEEKGEEGWGEIIINYLGLLLIIIMIIKLVIEVGIIYKKRGEMWEGGRWWDLLRGVAVRVVLGIWGIERGIKRLKEGLEGLIKNLKEVKGDVIRSNITWFTNETGNNSVGSGRSASYIGREIMRGQMRSRSNSSGPSLSRYMGPRPWGERSETSSWDIRNSLLIGVKNRNHERVRSEGVLMDGRVRSELIRNTFNNSGIIYNKRIDNNSIYSVYESNYNVLEKGVWKKEENYREIGIKLSEKANRIMEKEGRLSINVMDNEGKVKEGYYRDELGQVRMSKYELKKYEEINEGSEKRTEDLGNNRQFKVGENKIGKLEDTKEFNYEEVRKIMGDISNATRVNDRYGITGRLGDLIKWGWDEIGKW